MKTRKKRNYNSLESVLLGIIGLIENLVIIFTLGCIWPDWKMNLYCKIFIYKLKQEEQCENKRNISPKI